jgi:hypothetical protein|tara:strand:- start:88 stop:279 length:192 start_codon:yes stop_codon:yes gene_type:complete
MKIPDYYNQSKPKPDEKECLVERRCYICNEKAKMGKFERYCSIHCRTRATNLDSNSSYKVSFR